MRRAEDVGVGRVGLLDAHLVGEPGALHVLRHLLAAAELVDERLIQPRLVDAQRGIGQQAVAIEALDVVAFERAAVAPDVDLVALHREDEHRAGNGAADRRGVEVGHAGGGDVEGAALQRGDALLDELRAAIDQPRLLGAIEQRLARDLVVVLLVRLSEVRRVGVGDGAFRAHPVKGGARVEAARKCDADFLACRYLLKNRCHAISNHRAHGCRVQELPGPNNRTRRTSGVRFRQHRAGLARSTRPRVRRSDSEAPRSANPTPARHSHRGRPSTRDRHAGHRVAADSQLGAPSDCR